MTLLIYWLAGCETISLPADGTECPMTPMSENLGANDIDPALGFSPAMAAAGVQPGTWDLTSGSLLDMTEGAVVVDLQLTGVQGGNTFEAQDVDSDTCLQGTLMHVDGVLSIDVPGLFVGSALAEVIFDEQGEMVEAFYVHGTADPSLAAEVQAELSGDLTYRADLNDGVWSISVIEESRLGTSIQTLFTLLPEGMEL